VTALEVWQLVRSGGLDLAPVTAHAFGLDQFDEAIDVARTVSGLDYAVLLPSP
jgi:hypothetical protein